MLTWLVRLLAATAFLGLVMWLFRLAMGLRYVKVLREQERRRHEAAGRRLVAEAPTHDGDLVLVLEDRAAFHWGQEPLPKAEILGVRLILNGRVIDALARPGVALPEAGWSEEYEGRERWGVRLDLVGGRSFAIPCGALREGVSREAAQQVYAAIARALAADPETK